MLQPEQVSVALRPQFQHCCCKLLPCGKERNVAGGVGLVVLCLPRGVATYILCAGYGGRLVVQIALPARVPAHLHEELLHAQSLLCHYLCSSCLGSDHSALYLDDGLTLDLQHKER